MKIKTITCHEVYNHGATLQELALLDYLETLGHQAETIHYKPHYLDNHFKLWRVSNNRFQKNFILRFVYLTVKLPGRIMSLKRKKKFDTFSNKYIKSTSGLYRNNEELKTNLPEADAYICGSDQIWNSFFPNGKDPSFYLDFVPDNKLKISYAASFAIEKLEDNIKEFVKSKILRLNHISVRESSGLRILDDLGIKNACQVLDPVFLKDYTEWEFMANDKFLPTDKYLFLYDFEGNPSIKNLAMKLKEKFNWKIITVNQKIGYADNNYYAESPDIFLSLVKNADFVISNSFHAVAFSIIFEKDFIVFNRKEKINTRMRDMLKSVGLLNLLIDSNDNFTNFEVPNVTYENVNLKLEKLKDTSKRFLQIALENYPK